MNWPVRICWLPNPIQGLPFGVAAAPLDVRAYPDRYEALLDVPGVSPEHIHIALHEQQLVIQVRKGGSEGGEAAGDDGGVLLHQERLPRCAAQRLLVLPRDVALDDIAATLANGVLKVSMPKASVAGGRSQKTIQVSKL